jgi:hypothetical protein
MTRMKTSAIIVMSMALGIVGGAGLATVAQTQTKTIIKTPNDQPNMQAALDHLVAANAFLDKANNNKGGHRVKAQSLINLAIGEVKAGIKSANN